MLNILKVIYGLFFMEQYIVGIVQRRKKRLCVPYLTRTNIAASEELGSLVQSLRKTLQENRSY